MGTEQGKVHVYQVDGKDYKQLLYTRGGVSYGAVTSLSVYPDGETFIVGTQTGELISFLFKENAE